MTHNWIRPVSKRPDKELSEQDRFYDIEYCDKNSLDPEVLDIINIVFINPDPYKFQTENYLIDDGYYWSFIRKATYQEALDIIDPLQEDLWGTDTLSSYHGENDRLLLEQATKYNQSLRLIHVHDLKIRVLAEKAAFQNYKKIVRGFFTYNNIQYALTITDPKIEQIYFNKEENTYIINEALLCISLGVPYNNYTYKLIASVILPSQI